MSDLQLLISMGFSKERCEEALTETNNAGVEVALEWLFIMDGIDTVDKSKDECDSQEPPKRLPDSQFEEAAHKITSEVAKISVNSNEKTRILVRLLNGKTVTKEFNSDEKLNEVLQWIRSFIPNEQFDLTTNFPKKVFSYADYERTLKTLNLVPSAVVIATQPDKWNDLKEYRGSTDDDENRKIEEKRRKDEVEQQFKKMEEERLALERVRRQIDDDKAARRQRWPNLYTNSDQPSGNQSPAQNQSRALLAHRRRSDRNEKSD